MAWGAREACIGMAWGARETCIGMAWGARETWTHVPSHRLPMLAGAFGSTLQGGLHVEAPVALGALEVPRPCHAGRPDHRAM